MRKSLEELVNNSIIYKFSLPNEESGIPKTSISGKHDYCYKSSGNDGVAEVIYNGIIDYAYGETHVDLRDLNAQQRRALATRIRYNEEDEEETKIKYGFYGEVVLNLILEKLFASRFLVAKGYFYNPTNNRETHGYDAFHSFYRAEDNALCLVVGEAKFHSSQSIAIEDAVQNITKATSEAYFNRNYLAIMNYIEDFGEETIPNEIKKIFIKWHDNPSINIWNEIKSNNISLLYPILIMCNKSHDDFCDTIKSIVNSVEFYIKKHKPVLQIHVSILFVFLPVDDTKAIKKEVIKWITENKPVL